MSTSERTDPEETTTVNSEETRDGKVKARNDQIRSKIGDRTTASYQEEVHASGAEATPGTTRATVRPATANVTNVTRSGIMPKLAYHILQRKSKTIRATTIILEKYTA